MKIFSGLLLLVAFLVSNQSIAQTKSIPLRDSTLPKPLLYCPANSDTEKVLFDDIKYHNYDGFLRVFNKGISLDLREEKTCHSLLTLSIINMNDVVFNFLMSKGADYSSYDKWGNASCYCALYGRTEYLKILLEKGISPDTRTVFGATLLHFAVSEAKYETVRLLIKNKARMDIKDEDGNTVLDRAKKHKMDEMVKILEDAGAK